MFESASNLSNRRKPISYRNYVKQLCMFVFSSSIVLGLIASLVLLVTGETTMEVDLTFEFERIDGLSWLIGVPFVALLVLLMLSPLSFLIHRRLAAKQDQ